MLRHYTADGFRVLALACRPMSTVRSFEDALQLTRWVHAALALDPIWFLVCGFGGGATQLAVPDRDVAECSLTFLGFLVMKNVLKMESAPVITLLRNAGVRPVMVTGGTAMGGQGWGRGARRGRGAARGLRGSDSMGQW